jgi:hypothetical protein
MKATFKSSIQLSETMFEIEELITNVKEVYPLHVGNTILHMSKLLLAKFVVFLEKFLKYDTFRLIYTGKLQYL